MKQTHYYVALHWYCDRHCWMHRCTKQGRCLLPRQVIADIVVKVVEAVGFSRTPEAMHRAEA